MREQWAMIPGFPDYEVSSEGRVRSWVYGSKGGRLRRSAPLVLSQRRKRTGYMQVRLSTSEGHHPTRMVHRLVLEAFLGPQPTPLHESSHENGQRDDNRLANLRWRTTLENNRLKHEHGTMCRGEGHGRAKLTEREVAIMRRLRAECGLPLEYLGGLFGVAHSQVQRITTGKSWGEDSC